MFNFQDDEGQEMAQQVAAKGESMAMQNKSTAKPGRPRNQPALGGSKNQNMEDDEMYDAEEDDDAENWTDGMLTKSNLYKTTLQVNQ